MLLSEPPQSVVRHVPAEQNESAPWFAIYVRSHFERAVEQCLKGKGYQAFSPFYQDDTKRSGRTKVLDLPLFPGYVFCSSIPTSGCRY